MSWWGPTTRGVSVMNTADSFRSGMQRLASGVSIVAASAADGGRYGMTATAVFSLSVEPPSLVVGVNRDTMLGGLLSEVREFSVNILGTGHLEVAEAFAGRISGTMGADRFGYGKWSEDATRPPLLQDAAAGFVCQVDAVLPRRTHLLIVGLVTEVRVAEDQVDPLVYFSRRFASVTEPSRQALNA
uniref:PyrE4 n=1 Tax=Streptomyces rugosporus TaxID=295838 RepID=K7QVV5_STRRG|nr:PyrE4 [Streptomyces rugosporus]